MIRGPGCSKSRFGKAAGAEVAVQQRNEKWHAAVGQSTFSSQNAQNTAFAKQFFEVTMLKKMHAAVTRSTFSSQNAQNPSAPEQFLKLQCRKMARGCGAKRFFQVKMQQSTATPD